MKKNSQNGSAIIWVFIAVGLFAALSFTFMQSNRTSTNLIDDEQTAAYANEIIAYGNEVKNAVKRLQLRGCNDTEISFENDIVSDYINANSPTNKKCHVFNINGGGLSWKTFNKSAYMHDGFNPALANWYISSSDQILNIGTDCADSSCTELVFHALGLKKEICLKINNLINITNPADNPPAEDMVGSPAFTGTYSYNAAYIVGDSSTELANQKNACYSDTSGTNIYSFYSVLIER